MPAREAHDVAALPRRNGSRGVRPRPAPRPGSLRRRRSHRRAHEPAPREHRLPSERPARGAQTPLHHAARGPHRSQSQSEVNMCSSLPTHSHDDKQKTQEIIGRIGRRSWPGATAPGPRQAGRSEPRRSRAGEVLRWCSSGTDAVGATSNQGWRHGAAAHGAEGDRRWRRRIGRCGCSGWCWWRWRRCSSRWPWSPGSGPETGTVTRTASAAGVAVLAEHPLVDGGAQVMRKV